MHMSRLTRLTNILLQLQSRKVITSRELAGKFGISQRTVYRDIRALEEAGVPVMGEIGTGYSLPDDYRIPPVMVTQQELTALLTAQKYFESGPDVSVYAGIQSLVTKIKTLVRYSTMGKAEKLEQRIRFYHSPGNTKTNHLASVQSAIADNKLIEIRYHAIYSDVVSQRQLEPLAVYYTKDKWVMIAYCHLRGALREFRIDRILHLKITDVTFPERHFSFEEYIADVIKNS